MPPPNRLRRLLPVLLLLGGAIYIFLWYQHTRPRLKLIPAAQRLEQIRAAANNLGDGPDTATRATMLEMREFMLDYPQVRDPAATMKLTIAMAAQPDADWPFIANTMEDMAATLLAKQPFGKAPTQKDFEAAGFHFDSYGFNVWPTPFLTTDIDGDGLSDLLFACPGGAAPSVVYLFRQTKQGWISYPLGIGAPLLGMWIFDITPHGPKALVLVSLVGEAYQPTVLFDVFVWQNGRMTSVLSTLIKNGWQWDHAKADKGESQEIHLYPDSPDSYWTNNASKRKLSEEVYRWDGKQFIKRGMRSKPTPHENAAPVVEKDGAFDALAVSSSTTDWVGLLDDLEARLFERQDYAASQKELEAYAERLRASDLASEDKTDLLLESCYAQALCYRKMGQMHRAEVLLAALRRGYSENVWGERAAAWLN